ncbi:hypothetical protein [Thermophagus xiamenensis]|uniref:hypothetical protein n=1 Tax=Thermophagus xiamenensis TaxID=385682 RepID=UPI000255D511|nr:hypothetical protein [Thermophagus xiamenensis]
MQSLLPAGQENAKKRQYNLKILHELGLRTYDSLFNIWWSLILDHLPEPDGFCVSMPSRTL